jgi:predicted porin
MQKKLIALAVAGLASTAAFAQTNVQIYGSIDYGYSYRFDARNPVPGGSSNGYNSASQFNGGQSAGNRLGFKGTEDLGNGLKAVFLLEQGFNIDTSNGGASTDNANSLTFTRQAYVGLTGNFGTAVGGRLYTPHYTFVSSLDPFAAGTVGRYNNVFGGTAGDAGASLFDPVRVNNAIAYISPSFGGFTVTGAYSNNATANDSTVSNAWNNTVYAVLGQYANGPINAGLGYHYIAGASPSTNVGVSAIDKVQNIVLGGSYDFKVVKLALVGDWNELDYTNSALSNARLSNYMIGATVPVGKFDIQGSYIFSDGNRQAGGDAQQIALGAKYNLSKRTNFYTAYSYIDNSNNRNAAVGDATNTGYATGASYNPITGIGSGIAWQQGFQIGVRHQF